MKIKTASLMLVAFFAGWFGNGILTDDSTGESSDQSEALVAWLGFVGRMQALGLRLQAEDLATTASLGTFPMETGRDRAEGITQLAHMVVEGLRWEFDHADPKYPMLMVSDTNTTAWGGPNVDNKYLRARVSGDYRYQLTGNLAGVREIAIQTTSGDMHMGEFGASDTIDKSGLSVDEDGNFTLTISQQAAEGDWLPLDPDHSILSIRIYFADWAQDEEAQFYLANLDTAGKAPPHATEADVARRLANAADWIEGNLLGWNRFMKVSTATYTENEASEPRSVAGGSTTLAYGGIPLALEPDEALIINFEAPEAAYWSFQTYSWGWFASGDYANRLTSLNMEQVQRGPEDDVWIVVSHQDPGVGNWIDMEGRQQLMLTHRWLNARKVHPMTTQLVKLEDIADYLPAALPRLTAQERQQQIAVRQRFVQSLFHN